MPSCTHKGPIFHISVDAADSEELYNNYGDDWTDEWGYYEGDDGSPSYYGGDDDEWEDADEFDAQAAYYQYEETAGDPSETVLQDVDTYDEVYAAYVDARRRFSDLKLARGFLPVAALNDPTAGNLASGVTSPAGSPSSKGIFFPSNASEAFARSLHKLLLAGN